VRQGLASAVLGTVLVFGGLGSFLASAGEAPGTAQAVSPYTKDCVGGLKLFPDDRSLIDPELLPTLQSMVPQEGEKPPAGMDEVRARFLEGHNKRLAAAPAAVAGVAVEERRVPGPDGAPPVRILIYRPEGAKSTSLPALLDIHGGSFILGFPEMNDSRNRMLAKDLSAVVVSVDYRLAPEHPFPAGLQDSYAVLRWLHSNAASLGVDAQRIAVAGDSAGGALAAGVALMARDKRELPVKALMLVYPALDDRSYTKADPTCAAGTAPGPTLAYALYVGVTALTGDMPQYAFPAREKQLRDLPQTFIAVGAVDGLADQGIEFAQRLIWAEVPTELRVYPGAFHGFDLGNQAAVTQRFHEDLRQALRQAWQ
jgi:acetyl esterase/lipase